MVALSLLVAVKNETIQSYLQAIQAAGLEPTIGDIDYFALENMFALAYPEEQEKTVALVNVGSRFTSVSIIQKGESLFAGDVGVGGRLYTDTLCEATGMDAAAAEQIKIGVVPEWVDKQLIEETRDRTTEHIAAELHRQIGFFWNAASTEGSIETIFVCGGSAFIPGLIEELGARTGIVCSGIDPFRGVQTSVNIDRSFIGEVGLGMGACLGVALRRTGDKVHCI